MGFFDRDDPEHKTGAALTAKAIREKYERAAKAMATERNQYVLNKAFLQGHQWVYFVESQNMLREHPRDDSRVRVTLNRLRPASRHLMSKLMSRDLVFQVPPSDTDAGSIRGAKTAEAVLEDIRREHKWEELRESLAWSTWLGGTAGLSIDWDASGGTPISTLAQTGATVGTGELCATPHNILEMVWEPGTRDAERGYWWARAQAMPSEEAQLRYGLKKRPASDAHAATGYMGRSITAMGGDLALSGMTLVITYYERPNKLRPQGAIATVIGNEIVDGGVKAWNFPWKDRLNLIIFRESKADGRASGETVFSDAILVQTAYNAAWSSLLEHGKLSGNARLLWPEGSEEIDDLSDLPGEVVSFAPSLGKPEWLSPPQLPAWQIQQPDRLAAQLDDILGLHDVSRGVAPGGLESGVAVGILVEQDSTPVGNLTKELASGFARFGSLALRLYEAKVRPEDGRVARVYNGTIPESRRWDGKALAGQTVVIIPLDAVMPRSKAAMLAFAERMLQLRVLPEGRPEIFAKVADLPFQGELMTGLDPAGAKADRENAAFCVGVFCAPAPFDIHDTHIARHNEFRMSTAYESMSPEERELVDLHIQGHETLMAEQMGIQQAKALVAPALAGVATADLHPSLPEGMGPASPNAGMEAAPTGPPAAPDPAGNPPPGTMSPPAE